MCARPLVAVLGQALSPVAPKPVDFPRPLVFPPHIVHAAMTLIEIIFELLIKQ